MIYAALSNVSKNNFIFSLVDQVVCEYWVQIYATNVHSTIRFVLKSNFCIRNRKHENLMHAFTSSARVSNGNYLYKQKYPS